MLARGIVKVLGIAVAVAVVVVSLAAAGARAVAAECAPACEAEQTCVDGVCMIPALPVPRSGPPPGYSPPGPETAPPPAVARSTARVPRASGFLALPFLGFHSYRGSGWQGFDAGVRLGAVLGARASEAFSLNGKIAVDLLNPDPTAFGISGITRDARAALVSVTPLVHLRPSPKVEIVVGPELGGGYFWESFELSSAAGPIAGNATTRGWLLGLQGGVFVAAGDTVSVGGLLSYSYFHATNACSTASGVETCDGSPSFDSPDILSLGLAILY